jgi:enoyl-CoA hydratase/carnithine racemase
MSTPFISLALVPDAASSLLMPLRLGHARAFELFALREPISANVALAFWTRQPRGTAGPTRYRGNGARGSVSQKQPLGSLVATKRLMRNAETLMKQMEAEAEYFESRLKLAEAREVFQAFTGRQPPDFAKAA